MHGRCHVWPWLIEFSGVALSCVTLSRRTTIQFPDVTVSGILVQPRVVQGNNYSLFSVMGLETCVYQVQFSAEFARTKIIWISSHQINFAARQWRISESVCQSV